MPLPWKITDDFPNLEDVEVKNIAFWLGNKINPDLLYNQFANLLLYPQTIPATPEELNFQLAVFKEGLRLNYQKFYSQTARKIIIPERFLSRFPEPLKLVTGMIDVLPLLNLVSIYFQSERLGVKPWGSLVSPDILGEGLIDLEINGQKHLVKTNTLTQVPAPDNKINFKFESTAAKLFGKNLFLAQIDGGELGVILDSRKKGGHG